MPIIYNHACVLCSKFPLRLDFFILYEEYMVTEQFLLKVLLEKNIWSTLYPEIVLKFVSSSQNLSDSVYKNL